MRFGWPVPGGGVSARVEKVGKMFGGDGKKPYICSMEKLREKTQRPESGYSVREEIMQGMIASFRMEGIRIPRQTACAILEKVGTRLKTQKR